jgi:hypothetical protein
MAMCGAQRTDGMAVRCRVQLRDVGLDFGFLLEAGLIRPKDSEEDKDAGR